MRKSVSDDCVFKLSPTAFAEEVDKRIVIDKRITKEIYKLLVKLIKDLLMDGKIVQIESLGYFYLHIMNRPYYMKHYHYGNVDSKVIVKPNFRPSSPVLLGFTQRYGSDNIFEGLDIVERYDDKIAESERKEHEIIRQLAVSGFPDKNEEQMLIDHYDREITMLEKRIKKLKAKKRNDLRFIRGKNSSGQQY